MNNNCGDNSQHFYPQEFLELNKENINFHNDDGTINDYNMKQFYNQNPNFTANTQNVVNCSNIPIQGSYYTLPCNHNDENYSENALNYPDVDINRRKIEIQIPKQAHIPPVKSQRVPLLNKANIIPEHTNTFPASGTQFVSNKNNFQIENKSTNYTTDFSCLIQNKNSKPSSTLQVPYDYLYEIWENLIQEEHLIDTTYESLLNQKDINEKMRAILIDWLIEVHFRFSLKPETLFLTVNIIDRYISHVHIERSKLQLVGVAALFISCKYEEILCPDLKDFVYITDKTYDKKEILNMEIDILNALNFNLTMPSSLRFFELLSLNFRFNDVEIMYGRYLLELFLIDPKMNKYSPSLIALAAAYIVMKINSGNHRELYNLVNTQVKNGSSKHLKECAKEIYYLVQNPENLYLQAVFKKFSTATYLEVAQNGCKS